MAYNPNYPYLTSINFTIRNISPQRKRLTIFGTPVEYLQTRNLLRIDGVTEAVIRSSLIKGELANKLRVKAIEIVSSTIDLEQFDPEQESFIVNSLESPAEIPGITPATFSGTSSQLTAGDGSAVSLSTGLNIISSNLTLSEPITQISLFSGVQTANSATLVRCGAKEINLNYFPATFNGKNLTITLQAVLEVSSDPATATLTLYDITPPVPVVITNSSINTSSTSSVTITSEILGRGNSSGTIWTSPLHTYELDLQLSAGSGIATCSGAWLSITYV